MIVEMGNSQPHQCSDVDGVHSHPPLGHGEPAVYRWSCPDDATTHEEGADAMELMRHMTMNTDVTHLPGQEAFVSIVRDWPHHSAIPPTWVESSNADLQRVLAEFFGCEEGRPDDLEDTHYTMNGPPGVGPDSVPGTDETYISEDEVADLEGMLNDPPSGEDAP